MEERRKEMDERSKCRGKAGRRQLQMSESKVYQEEAKNKKIKSWVRARFVGK